MELDDTIRGYLAATAEALQGHDRRLFMARTVRLLGPGGQREAERLLGWNRITIRKGLHELDSGIRCIDYFAGRGRKPVEVHLPALLSDIRAILDAQSQTDPSFRSQRLYTRLTAAVVRQQLILARGYNDSDLPCVETIRRKMHDLGYRLHKVAKCRPKKRYLRPTPFSPA